MFIIPWFIIVILRANSVVVPTVVSTVIGVLAILETTLYVCMFLFTVAVIIFGIRKEREKK